MKKPVPLESASAFIDEKIKELGDWRGKTLAKVREIIHEADPEIVEEWKWRGTPVWSHSGIVCTGETYKKVVKMTFAKGAALKDPASLFNSSLESSSQGQEQAEAPASEQQAGRLASSHVPAISPPIGEELRHLPHTPSSSASRPRAGRRRALGLDRVGDCHVYGTSIWRSSVSRADEIGGRRRLSHAIVVRLYEPAGKAASRGQRPEAPDEARGADEAEPQSQRRAWHLRGRLHPDSLQGR